MLEESRVRKLLRSYLENANPAQNTGVFPDLTDQLNRLMNASNIDVRVALIDELTTGVGYERLMAAQLFLSLFCNDEQAHEAIAVFRDALESEFESDNISAFALLYTTKNIPHDLLDAIETHMNGDGVTRIAAATIATEFSESRATAFCQTWRIIGGRESRR